MAAKEKKTSSKVSVAKSRVAKPKTLKSVKKQTAKKAVSTESSVMNATIDKPVMQENSKPRNKTITGLLLLVLVLGLLYYFKDLFVVATVNGKPITRAAVVGELEKQNGKQVVDNLLTKELILQEASKKGVTVSSEDVSAEITKIEEELGAQGQTLDQVLEMQGLSRGDVEENLRVKLYIERILADEVSVSDEDAKAYYDQNKTLYGTASFDDQKDAIKQSLQEQKLQEKFQTWITDLKASASINYFKTY